MKRLVLAGAGHAHAEVLRAWTDDPIPGVDLVVVSPVPQAPYSGMVPGWLAGTYRFDDITIDFTALCAAAGARWIAASVSALDTERQVLQLDTGERLAYHRLSLNIGSTVTPPARLGQARILPLRPLSALRRHYEQLLDAWLADTGTRPLRVTAVGGGAAGFESLLAVLRRLRQLRPDRSVEGSLLTRSDTLLPGHPARAQRAAALALRNAGVALTLGMHTDDPTPAASDVVLWATGAEAHPWLTQPSSRGALAVSPQGFVQIDPTLRSISHPHIYAVGDCAQWQPPLPKAGVYAVRMGPVLAHNLGADLLGQPLARYTAQTDFLTLLSTADGRAIASRGGFSASGRWAWWLKHRIDQRFIRRYAMDQAPQPSLKGETP